MSKKLVKNSVWLTISQIAGLAIPLFEIPILARTLGQAGLGQIMYVTGIALISSLFIEFGFNFSAARDVLHYRQDKQKLSQLVSDIFLAKILLFSVVFSAVTIFFFFDVSATAVPKIWLIWIAVYMIGFGFTPLWFFVGIERLSIPAIADVVLRSIGLLSLFIFVTRPQQVELVIIIQASVGIFNTLIPTFVMLKLSGVARPSLKGAISVIRKSWSLFLYKGGQSAQGSISSTILGSFSGAVALGAFVPAEKLMRAASGLSAPVLTALFPHAVEHHKNQHSGSKKLTLKFLTIFMLLGSIAALFAIIFGDWLVFIIFGQGFNRVTPILNLLIWALPFRIGSGVLAILWFIPKGKEKISSIVMAINLLIILLLAIVLIPFLSGLGMALSVLISEIICFFILLLFFVTDQKPVSIKQKHN